MVLVVGFGGWSGCVCVAADVWMVFGVALV